VLDDLDRTLLNVLTAEITTLDAGHVHFEPPDNEFRPSIPAVSLFLYDVRENVDLRDNDWLVDRSNGSNAVKRQPPRRVDCSYLITAWAGDSLSEHLLLGQVMQALLRHPTIGDPYLANTLQGQPPLPTGVLQPSLLQAIGEFWQAMGNKPRAALNYTVTVAVDVATPQDAYQVKEPVIRLEQKEQ
jgi:hypothetical protein